MGKLGEIIYGMSKTNKKLNSFIVNRMKTKVNLAGSVDSVNKAALTARVIKMVNTKIKGTRAKLEKDCEETLPQYDSISKKIFAILEPKIQKINNEEEFYNFKLMFTTLWRNIEKDVCSSIALKKIDMAKLKNKVNAQDFSQADMYIFESDNLKEIDSLFV